MKNVNAIVMNYNEFEDIIAAIALYRPGPMENIPTYLKRKHKQEPVTYIHEDLKEILEPTYGILISIIYLLKNCPCFLFYLKIFSLLYYLLLDD